MSASKDQDQSNNLTPASPQREGSQRNDDDPGQPVSQEESQPPPETTESRRPPPTRGRRKPQGNELAGLTEKKKEKYLNTFTEDELQALVKHYTLFDKSRGKDGIPFDKFINIPDFIGHPFIEGITKIYMKEKKKVILPEQYMDICTVLSSKEDVDKKRKLAFKVLDVHGMGCLQYDEIFRMYKLLFDQALSDDTIVDLTFKLLERDDLEEYGKLSEKDFAKLVPDSEINERFTVDVQLNR